MQLISSNTVLKFGVNDLSVENDILYRQINTSVNVNHSNIIFKHGLRTRSVKKVVFPLHAMMACRWSRGVAPFIRNTDGGQWLTSCPGHFTPVPI